MAVPKKKTSKARRDSRRANWKLENPTLAKCPKCGEMNLAHHVCKNCGSYKGETIVAKAEK